MGADTNPAWSYLWSYRFACYRMVETLLPWLRADQRRPATAGTR